MTDKLLQTKLFLPGTRSRTVPRPQLVARLDAGLEGRLTLVAAPAGFGKTTLVVQWAQKLALEGKWQLTWYSLDENDNDPGRFFEYFIAALQRISPRLGRSGLEQLRSPQPVDYQSLLADLINEMAADDTGIVLVIDDYHLVQDPRIHEALKFLIDHASKHFHLVLTSRADPPFPLARLRARGQLTEIRQADLRFTVPETGQFLNDLLALEIPETGLAALERRTEGWAAGLQMAALSLQGQADREGYIRNFTVSNRYILDYLAEEVLAQRPEGTRDFLLNTCFLDRLSASLCSAILRNSDFDTPAAAQILDQLETSNLFLVPLDDSRQWYRFHALFAGLLQQVARLEIPTVKTRVQSRASRWFEGQGLMEEATLYALRAGETPRVAGLLLEACADWLRQGEIGKVLLWTDRLPEGWMEIHPDLALRRGWALLFGGRPGDVEALLAAIPEPWAAHSIELLVLRGTLAVDQRRGAEAVDLLEEAVSELGRLPQDPWQQALRGIALNALAFSYQVQGRIEQSDEKYREGTALSRKAGDLFPLIKALLGWSILLLMCGRLVEAEQVLLEGIRTEAKLALQMGLDGDRLVQAAQLHLYLAQVYYQWNRLDEAEARLTDGGEPIEISNPADRFIGLEFSAKLRLARDQRDNLKDILGSLERAAPGETVYIRRQQAASLLEVRCTLHRAQPSAEHLAALEKLLPPSTEAGVNPVSLAWAHLLLDRAEEALAILAPFAQQMEAAGMEGEWLRAAVLLSLVQDRQEDADAAISVLRRVVEAAAANGTVRRFLDQGEPMRRLLSQLDARGGPPAYTKVLLEAFKADARAADSAPEPSPLSPREREVLELIARGLSNREIAEQLVIAPSTAKRHVINIYNKLDINNRAEATARAYELGIVRLD